MVNDTLSLWEYDIKFSHNLDIDLVYDPNITIYVIGTVVFFCYIIYLKIR